MRVNLLQTRWMWIGTAVFLLILTPLSFATAQSIVPCDGVQCNACHFVELGNRIVNFLIAVMAVLGAIGIVWGGFLMISAAGDTGKVEQGKKIILSVIVGFIIVLACFLIIDTIMKSFFDEARLGPWNQIQCEDQPVPGMASGGENPGVPAFGQPDRDSETHDDAIRWLDQDGIVVTSTTGEDGVMANCSGTGCTSLEGIQLGTLEQMSLLKEGCPSCEIIVTGGTESGVHSTTGSCTHESGCKIDLEDTSSLNAYLESSLNRSGTRSGDPMYVDGCGNTYVRESTHWDVAMTGDSGPCGFHSTYTE